jgi:hypothetical protein
MITPSAYENGGNTVAESGILRSDKGLALIVALLVLLVLTLIGISAISTTTFENRISGNERIAASAFYTAEGGVEGGSAQLPSTVPIPVTPFGEGSSYWSGSPKDRGNPRPFVILGDYVDPGSPVPSGIDVADNPPGTFKRYQIHATGESFGATKEIEVQIRADIH